jgi:predicted MFS family arabinose efflux permease
MRFPVLGVRDFRILLVDRLIAPASFGFSLVGVSFAVLNTTGSSADLSYVLAAQIAPSLVFALLGGIAADRFPPQFVIIAANVLMAIGEGTFGLLALTGHPPLWAMITLEAVTGTGIAIFYPASAALLPRLVPDAMLQEANAISRAAMNAGIMAGSATGGALVAAAGPGWALTVCSAGMVCTVPVLLSLRVSPGTAATEEGLIGQLREGWTEFWSHTWLWVIVLQAGVVMMCWYGAFTVLGPVVARAHLGGPTAWGAISAADACGLIGGGLISLRLTPRRPMLFVVLALAAVSVSPVSLALVLPLPLVCLASFLLGLCIEVMMVQWMVALTRNIPPSKLARVSSYDALGSVMAMPLGALAAGPLGAAIGVSRTQFIAAGAILAASALALIPRDIWSITSDVERVDQVDQPAQASPLHAAGVGTEREPGDRDADDRERQQPGPAHRDRAPVLRGRERGSPDLHHPVERVAARDGLHPARHQPGGHERRGQEHQRQHEERVHADDGLAGSQQHANRVGQRAEHHPHQHRRRDQHDHAARAARVARPAGQAEQHDDQRLVDGADGLLGDGTVQQPHPGCRADQEPVQRPALDLLDHGHARPHVAGHRVHRDDPRDEVLEVGAGRAEPGQVHDLLEQLTEQEQPDRRLHDAERQHPRVAHHGVQLPAGEIPRIPDHLDPSWL